MLDRSTLPTLALSTAITALPCAAAVSGEAVYQKRCAACHDSASETTPPRDALKQLSVARILRTLDFGVMINVAYVLNRDEREAVANYLGVDTPRCAGARAGLLRGPHREHWRVAEPGLERLGSRSFEHALHHHRAASRSIKWAS